MLICNLCFWNSKIKITFLKNKDAVRGGGLGLLKFSFNEEEGSAS